MVEVAVFLVVGVDANSQGAILQGGAAIDCGIAPLQCGQLGGGRQKLLTAGAFDDVVDGAARRVEAVEEARRSLQNVDPLDVLRSEEHTSELQSLMRISYAVFCLQKKKTQNTNTKNHN